MDHGSVDGGNEGNEGRGSTWELGEPAPPTPPSTETIQSYNKVSGATGAAIVAGRGKVTVTTTGGTKLSFEFEPGVSQDKVDSIVQSAVDYANTVSNGDLSAQHRPNELSVIVQDIPPTANGSYANGYHQGGVIVLYPDPAVSRIC